MKILMINVVCGIRSTGRICTDLASILEAKGHKVKIAYGREEVPEQFQKYAIRIGTNFDVKLHGLKARMFDACGFGSKEATKKFIEWVKQYDPDVIWLHNLHGYYINVEILFDYLRTSNKKLYWTLHDCWTFTGHCVHFTNVECYKWINGCYNCPQTNEYPKSYTDGSKSNYKRKKDVFCGIPNLTIITVSEWLKKIVENSYLKKYEIIVKHNVIDKNVFVFRESNYRRKLGLEGKTIVLGVSSSWEKRKGLNDFIRLSEMLGDDYRVVLVGVDKRKAKKIPKRITTIGLEHNPVVLSQIYSMADVFVNLSTEETFGMTTAEALSCGTKAIVYKGTAGEEIISEYSNGVAVDRNLNAVFTEIVGKNENFD